MNSAVCWSSLSIAYLFCLKGTFFCKLWASPWERLCPSPCRSFPLLPWGRAYTKIQQTLQKIKWQPHSQVYWWCPPTIQTLLVGFHIPQPHFLTCTSKFTAIVLFLSDSMNKETTLICHYIFFLTWEKYTNHPRVWSLNLTSHKLRSNLQSVFRFVQHRRRFEY